jgi:hypothetical protein
MGDWLQAIDLLIEDWSHTIGAVAIAAAALKLRTVISHIGWLLLAAAIIGILSIPFVFEIAKLPHLV